MGLLQRLPQVLENYKSVDWWTTRVFAPFVIGTATRLHPRYPGYGESVRVMQEDWDTLIVIDACRADYFQQVAEMNKFDHYSTRASLGSHSSEWTRRNFSGESFGDTVYVSANPHTALEAADGFHEIVELWETGFDDDEGTVLPGTVRDAAIEAHEKYPHKRLIVHFMQPHGPYIGSDIEPEYEDKAEHWKAYEQNLEHVLSYVDDTVKNVPGKTVVTADHGEIYNPGIKARLGLTGHNPRLRFPALVDVPWAVIDGPRRTVHDGGTTEADGDSVESRLKDLGYL